MAIRFNRTAVVDRGKRDRAMAFAAEVSQYVTENFGTPVTWGMEVGGTFGKIHWFSDYADMAELEAALARTMADEGYRKLIDEAADVFVVGETEDTLVYLM